MTGEREKHSTPNRRRTAVARGSSRRLARRTVMMMAEFMEKLCSGMEFPNRFVVVGEEEEEAGREVMVVVAVVDC